MMNLEELVKSKREEADILDPNPNLWAQIESKLPPPPPPNNRLWPRWGIAAALLICLGIGYIGGKNSPQQTKQYADIKALDPQYAHQMAVYNTIIQEKRKTLAQLKIHQPTLYGTFQHDWEALEESYQELRGTLPNHPNKEELLKAMIENLRWQSDLLEQQVHILENIKSHTPDDEMA